MVTPVSGSRSRQATRAVITALCIAVAASLTFSSADARLGGGGSFGSRGSRTFSMPAPTPTAPSISPFNRPSPGYGYNPGYAGAQRPGFFGGGFGRGLLGGFLGAGLFGLLFGNGFAGGLGGGASLIGLILQLGLLYLAFRFIMGMFRQRQTAFGGAGYGTGSMFGGGAAGAGFGGAAARPGFGGAPQQGAPLSIEPADYQAFERRLVESQQAYSNGDIGTLRRVATPEMVSNFEQELSDNARQGVVNRISNVRLLQGDLSEAWSERGYDYATVAMRFTLVDVTEDRQGRVVAGHPSSPQTVTEVWTFVRPSGRGPEAWILSAIQQG